MRTITDPNDKNARYLKYFQEQIAAKDREALVKILRTESGRWFLMRLLDRTKVLSEAFTGNSQTFYNEGRRSIGIGLLEDIAALGVDGITLKQKAEREYIKNQQQYRQQYLDVLKEED